MKKSEKLCNIHIVFVLKSVGKCAIIRVRAAVYVLSAYSLCRLSAHLSSKMHLLFYTIIFISFRLGEWCPRSPTSPFISALR